MNDHCTNEELIEGLFRESIFDLLSCYLQGVEIVINSDATSRAADVTAIVGLGDRQLSAAVSLTTTAEDAALLAGPQAINPIDWIGELGNQLAGRLKNKLTSYGIQPRLSTPTIVRGQQLQVDSAATTTFSFWVEADQVKVLSQMTLELEPGLNLTAIENEEPMIEGEIALF